MTSPTPSSSQNELPTELTVLTIRFSAAIPDLQLQVASPSCTTGAGLKQLIRDKLSDKFSKRRIRLIYAGRALEDDVSLVKGLKLKREGVVRDDWYNYDYPPPSEEEEERHYKGKGKATARDVEEEPATQAGNGKSRIYIHCSIGDIVLSDDDLATEEKLARIEQLDGQSQHGQGGGDQSAQLSTEDAPRGFDRLLSAGFTVSEVSALRSQFLALQSLTHTPETMPRGEALRRLEDRWMDEGSTRDGAQETGGLGGGLTDGGASGQGLDDMLYGCVMGFFWPVGCALWLMREEGVWTWRKGLAVFVGVVVNFGFGMMRAF